LDPHAESASITSSAQSTKNPFEQGFDPIFLTTTTAAVISDWTRIQRIRGECSHRKLVWLLKFKRRAGLIIATSDETIGRSVPDAGNDSGSDI
jgi:hypothetical protein